MAIEEVVVPDIGGAEGAEVIELLVQPGEAIEPDQGLIVLESDKASMEIPSTCAGTLVELLVKEGDELSEGAAVARIEVAGVATAGEGDGSEQAQAPAPTVAGSLREEAAQGRPLVEHIFRWDDARRRPEAPQRGRRLRA